MRLRPRRRAVGVPSPFVVGVGRSGTTLLRLMLDAHPELAVPPETGFAPKVIRAGRERPAPAAMTALLRDQRSWGDHRLDEAELERRLAAAGRLDGTATLRAFYGLYAEGQGKPRWGDKTPAYVRRMPMIERALPEARFIHVIRDGRDVALSRGRRRLATGDAPGPARVAEVWRDRILRAREDAKRVHHYLEVRYEDLVGDTEPTLRRVAAAIELPWDEAMLRYYERAPERLAEMARDLPAAGKKLSRSGDERMAAHALAAEPPKPERIATWRERMSEADRTAFEGVAGDLLAELGYEVGSGQTSGVA
ncbi:MAG: sulfotransferase family protein [Solirubrobacterales bacterium]